MVGVAPDWTLPCDVMVGLCALAKDICYRGEAVEPVGDPVHDHVCAIGIGLVIVFGSVENMSQDSVEWSSWGVVQNNLLSKCPYVVLQRERIKIIEGGVVYVWLRVV